MNIIKAICEFILVIYFMLFLISSFINKQPFPTIVGNYIRITQEQFRDGFNNGVRELK